MKMGWLIGIISAFVIISFIAGVCENAWFGTDAVTKLDILMRPFMATSIVDAIRTFAGTLFSAEFWGALWAILWCQYPFSGILWMMVRYTLFIPLSIAFIFSLGLATIRGVSSS